MIRLEMKSTILTEKQQNYEHYFELKVIKMDFFAGEEILPSD